MVDDACRPEFWLWLGPVIAVTAALLSAGLIQLLRPTLLRIALAHPNARSAHATPTPQGAGIAITAAVIAVSAVAILLACRTGVHPGARWIPFLAAGFVAAVGLADDIKAIPVSTRLALQSIAVAAVIYSLPRDLEVIYFLPDAIERSLLFVGGLWFVNLVNFMDGIDWMTVSAMVPTTAGFVLLGYLGALPPVGVVAALALLGALIGFAPFNRPVAKLFLGDAGSLPVGLLVGWLIALVVREGHFAAAFLLPLYYFADATLTLFRRMVNREEVWAAHRTHFYQRATTGGFSVTEVVTRVFVANSALVGLAAISVIADTLATDLLTAALGIGLVAWLLVIFNRGKR